MVWLRVDLSLPFDNPVLIFATVLLVIFFAPVLFAKLRIPGLLGLLIAGMLLGPKAFYVLERDASIELFGTVGLLYIMFMVGLEVDLHDFRRTRKQSLLFGLLTFAIPLFLAFGAGHFLLGYAPETALLFALLFSPHTLLAYPIVSRLGVNKRPEVTIAVGGTLITDTLALLLLAVVISSHDHNPDPYYWLKLLASLAAFLGAIVWLMPRLAMYFFKRTADSVNQYIFVLAMTFLAAFMAELAGLEAIIGAFLAGLSLNRFIPHTSPLMNRIEFVGNALFIPFFLIGVGMLVDLRVLFSGERALWVAGVMAVTGVVSKWLAAYFTQQFLHLSKAARQLLFGLTTARAAATLAAVLVGFKLGLLGEEVFNGAIAMILATCLVSSLVVEQVARRMAGETKAEPREEGVAAERRLLVPLSNPDNVDGLIDLALLLRPGKGSNRLFGLTVTADDGDGAAEIASQKLLEQAAKRASSADQALQMLRRVDVNITNGIVYTCREHQITDVLLGWNPKPQVIDRFFGGILQQFLRRSHQMVMVARQQQPWNTCRRLVLVLPALAHRETGMQHAWLWLRRLQQALATELLILAADTAPEALQWLEKNKRTGMPFELRIVQQEGLYAELEKTASTNDLLILVAARKGSISYHADQEQLPALLGKSLHANNFLLVYPQTPEGFRMEDPLGVSPDEGTVLDEPLARMGDLGKLVKKALGGTGE